ncbi:phosphohydrolase [Hydrocoleum sp. CS-953]|nr:phosphohydrolase [Hydrocoleum sp. CS-953]OZH56131.1 phosphohydrolase [Hydrocoleum sp. CS-953]
MMSIKLTERFQQALVLAYNLHSQQLRKDGRTPYIAHLLSVTALVLENGGNEDEAIAALLHDAVEDRGGMATRQHILELFGETVVDIVDGCTESETIPKPPWEERKLRYLQQISNGSKSVKLISLADKLHNGRDLLAALRQEGKIVWKRFNGGKEKTFWFYHSLVSCYEDDNYLKQEFMRIIAELEKF